MPLDSVPLPISSLPRIVCGPVLRRLTRASVSVWVACLEPDPITLTVRRRGAGPAPPSVTVTPTRVGANLWMTVLTAGAPGGAFEAGEVYEYELTAAWAAPRRIPIPWGDLSLPNATLPTFLAPPATAAGLVVCPHLVPEAARRRARRPVARAGGHGDAVPPARRRSRICWSCRATRSTRTRSATR